MDNDHGGLTRRAQIRVLYDVLHIGRLGAQASREKAAQPARVKTKQVLDRSVRPRLIDQLLVKLRFVAGQSNLHPSRMRIRMSQFAFAEYSALLTNRNYRSWHDRADGSDGSGMDLKETMAMNLRRVRHQKALTQEELADRAGLSTRYIGAIERADVSASVTVLGRIADALEVKPSILIS